MNEFYSLIAASFITIVLSVVMYLVFFKSRLKNISYCLKQIICGLVFGGLAVFGTETAAALDGVLINVRDAAPLCAGLIFGGPAGIIAGIIGAAERMLSVLWGGGEYTALACTIGTLCAGLIGAAVRRFFYSGKRPWMFQGLFIGAATEALHVSLVYFTHTDDLETAFNIINVVSVPMIVMVSVTVGLSLLLVDIIDKNKLFLSIKELNINETIQRVLLMFVTIIFFISVIVIPSIQKKYAENNTEDTLTKALSDIEAEVISTIDSDFDIEIMNDLLGDIIMNRHVGTDGFFAIINDHNKFLLATSYEKENINIGDLNYSIVNKPDGSYSIFNMVFDEEEYYAMHFFYEIYSVVAFIPVEEVMFPVKLVSNLTEFVLLLFLSAIYIVLYALIDKVILNNLSKVNKALTQISEGNLDIIVDVRNNLDFDRLSDDINSTVDTLKRYIDEANSRMDADLKLAKDIQVSALVNVFPPFPNRTEFDIYARNDTAKEVGGDFYDLYFTKHNLFNFIIADVSGKGIPAAMFMMRAKTLLKSLSDSGMPLNSVFTNGNASLCEGNDAGMFITAWQGCIDLESGIVEFINAGHNPPVIKRAEGKFEYLKSKVEFVLAGLDQFNYNIQTIKLNPGDTLLLYTDGVVEAQNIDKEFYGEQRFLDFLNSRKFTNSKILCDSIKKDVDNFVGEADQFDDITILAFKFMG